MIYDRLFYYSTFSLRRLRQLVALYPTPLIDLVDWKMRQKLRCLPMRSAFGVFFAVAPLKVFSNEFFSTCATPTTSKLWSWIWKTVFNFPSKLQFEKDYREKSQQWSTSSFVQLLPEQVQRTRRISTDRRRSIWIEIPPAYSFHPSTSKSRESALWSFCWSPTKPMLYKRYKF